MTEDYTTNMTNATNSTNSTDNNGTSHYAKPLTSFQQVYVTLNYIIAVVSALIAIIMFIGTIINKKTHRNLKTIHIQFFISVWVSCVYQFLNNKHVQCNTVLTFEIFTTFPVVSQLTCMMLCTYLMFTEQFETTKTKIYIITFIFLNWFPALGLESVFTEYSSFHQIDFFCRFLRGPLMYKMYLIFTGIFQFYFYLIIFFLFRKLRQLKATHEGDLDVYSKIFKKICIQFGCGLFYSTVMWFYVFRKSLDSIDEESGEGWFYFAGILYNLSMPVLLFVFIWSSNVRHSISQIPCFKCLGEGDSTDLPLCE